MISHYAELFPTALGEISKEKKKTRPILSHQLVISAHIIIGNITPFAQGIILE